MVVGQQPFQDLLETALELVDRDGLHELSMRKLASALDVEAMSLYRHVTNKNDLLAGLAELLCAEIIVAAPADPDWTTGLWTFGHALRDAIHRHPNALPVLLSGDVTPIPALQLFADQLEYEDPASSARYQAVSALRTPWLPSHSAAPSPSCRASVRHRQPRRPTVTGSCGSAAPSRLTPPTISTTLIRGCELSPSHPPHAPSDPRNPLSRSHP